MVTILPHTTRASGTLLTATIYNADHQNHVTNATTINATAAFLNVSNVWTTGQTFNVGLAIASTEAFFRSVNTDALRFAGGTSGLGAKIILTGGAHATAPNQSFIDADTTSFRNLAGGTPTVTIGGNTVWHAGNDSGADVGFLDGQNSAFYRNASSLNSGTVAAARMPNPLDADTLNGLTNDSAATVNTIMNRDSSGHTAINRLDATRVDTDQISHSGTFIIGNNGSEDFRFNADGFLSNGLTVTKTGITDAGTGLSFHQAGIVWISREAGAASYMNRDTSDGTVIQFGRAKTSVGTISVTASATAYNTSSDERLKHDFQPIDPSLIDQIDVYDFAWNHDNSRAYGIKAQELYTLFPYMVFRGDDPVNDMWSVDYAKLVPLLIAKVQDLEARLAALEAA